LVRLLISKLLACFINFKVISFRKEKKKQIKRQDRVSVLKCMRKTESCINNLYASRRVAGLSDLNND